MKHLRVFGCEVYAHKPIETRMKLEPKSTKCVFVGYNLEHSYDILGAGMLWKPEEARILKNFINQQVNIR